MARRSAASTLLTPLRQRVPLEIWLLRNLLSNRQRSQEKREDAEMTADSTLFIVHPPLASSLALTFGCYEDVYAEFDWDNLLDNTTDRSACQPERGYKGSFSERRQAPLPARKSSIFSSSLEGHNVAIGPRSLNLFERSLSDQELWKATGPVLSLQSSFVLRMGGSL